MVGYKQIRDSDRKRIFEAHEAGEDWKAVARALQINKRTAYHWLQKKQVAPKKRGGSVGRKTEVIMTALTTWIEENPSITIQEIKRLLQANYETQVSTTTIYNWLDGALIIIKKVRSVVSNINLPVNKSKRKSYMNNFFDSRSQGRNLIWIDETNFNLFCKRNEGRSRIGQRASIVLPPSRGANLHCIGAMSSTQLVYFTTRRGALKAEDFNAWITELVGECNRKGIPRPTLIIIDNAPAHARVEEAVDGLGTSKY